MVKGFPYLDAGIGTLEIRISVRRIMRFRSCPALALLFAVALALHAQTASNPIQLTVDLTDAPRKILHAHMTIPVSPGPLTLLYAKWIPGEHMPDGPIDNLAGLFITANGQQLTWTRDDVNMYAIRLTVPEGVTQLDVKDDFLATAAASGFSAGASTSASLALLSWNELVLYPAGHKDDADIQVQPSVILPQGWQYGTALTKTGGDATHVDFQTVPLEQLIDSPLLTGKYFVEIVLAPEVSPKHFLDIAADGPEDLKVSPDAVQGYSNLVRETGALYRRGTIRAITSWDAPATRWRTSASSITSRATIAYRNEPSSTTIWNCSLPICCRTSSRTRGTESTGARPGWRQGTTKIR